MNILKDLLGTESSEIFGRSLIGIYGENSEEFFGVTPVSIPGGISGGISGGTPVEFKVELPTGLLKQLAVKFLKELRWDFWRKSGMNSRGISEGASEEFPVEIIRNSRRSTPR